MNRPLAVQKNPIQKTRTGDGLVHRYGAQPPDFFIKDDIILLLLICVSQWVYSLVEEYKRFTAWLSVVKLVVLMLPREELFLDLKLLLRPLGYSATIIK